MGLADALEQLLAEGFKPDLQGASELPLLHRACARGHVAVCRLLIQCGGNPNFVVNGCTPLYFAAQSTNVDTCKLLLKMGADPNSGDLLPLAVAARLGQTDIIKVLLRGKAMADVRERNTSRTALYYAAISGELSSVQALLDGKASVNYACQDGATPLFAAARKGSLEIVRLLLKYGADQRPRCDGLTPLCEAAAQGHSRICIELIKAGALTDSFVNAMTPLYAVPMLLI